MTTWIYGLVEYQEKKCQQWKYKKKPPRHITTFIFNKNRDGSWRDLYRDQTGSEFVKWLSIPVAPASEDLASKCTPKTHMDRGSGMRGEVGETGRGEKREREREDINIFENGERAEKADRENNTSRQRAWTRLDLPRGVHEEALLHVPKALLRKSRSLDRSLWYPEGLLSGLLLSVNVLRPRVKLWYRF